MKRILACLLILLYVTTSMGMRVHVHYCMDKWAGIEFFGKREKCPGCGMDTRQEKKDCCRDVTKFLKSGKLHMAASGLVIMDMQGISPMCPSTMESPVVAAGGPEETLLSSGAPPGEPVYLRCRNLRI